MLQPIQNYGWSFTEDGNLRVKWDSESNVATVQNRVHSLLKGCKCSTGCSTGRCGCKRRGQTCSAGCQCLNCINRDMISSSPSQRDDDITAVTVEEDMLAGRLVDRDDEELLDWVFGEELQETNEADSDNNTEEFEQ